MYASQRLELVGLDGLVRRRKRHGLERHMIGPEIISKIELSRRALLHADRSIVQFERGAYFQSLADHEALSVKEIDGREIDTERSIARHGPGRVARQHVDFARLQGRKAVCCGQRHELDLGRIVENRSRNGAAEIDVEPHPVALRVGHAETGQGAIGAANQFAPVFDRLESSATTPFAWRTQASLQWQVP